MSDDSQVWPPRWNAYKWCVQCDYEEMVAAAPRDRTMLQGYFERHPSLFSFVGTPAAEVSLPPRALLRRRWGVLAGTPRATIPYGVISRPPEPVIDGTTPDFLWIRVHKIEILIVSIVVEGAVLNPTNRIGSTRHGLWPATERLRAYRNWLADPENRPRIKQIYGLSDGILNGREFTAISLFIGGNPQDAQEANTVARTSSVQLEYFRSHRSLVPDPEMSDLVTLRMSSSGGYEVTHVPATFTLNWSSAPSLVCVPGFERSIASSAHMAPARREHLLAQVAKWRDRVEAASRVVNDDEWD